MKKGQRFAKISLIICIFSAICLAMSGCAKKYNGLDDYHMIYDNVIEANKTFIAGGERDTLLASGEYNYNSYLALFPREKPEELKEFYYNWTQAMDYDEYVIYFSYELPESEYEAFCEMLAHFSVAYRGVERKPVYTDTLFKYPTYILQWKTCGIQSASSAEYVMLDDADHTVINVFKLFASDEEIDNNGKYDVKPVGGNYAAVSELCGDGDWLPKGKGFNIYLFPDETDDRYMPPERELIFSR